MTTRLLRALDNFIDGSNRRRLIQGVLGRLNPSDGSITYAVDERPDFVHVRVGVSGQLTPDVARNTGRGRVPLRPNLPIVMERKNGELVIVGEDYDSGLLENDSGSTGNDYGVTPHPVSAHSDAAFTTLASGEVVYYNGTNWINDALQERVEDFVAAQLTGNTGVIDATYNDTTGAITLTLDVSAADLILYSTAADTWAETALTAFARTLLDDADAAAMQATLGLTQEQIEDWIGAILVDGNGIDLSYVDATPAISAALTTLTSDWDIGEDRRIKAEALRARDSEGIQLEDTLGNYRVRLLDDGDTHIRTGTVAGSDFVLRATDAHFLQNYAGTTTYLRLDATAAHFQEKIRALSAAGLRLEDDGGNLGVFIKDDGTVGLGAGGASASSSYRVHLIPAAGADATLNLDASGAGTARNATVFLVADGGYIQFSGFGTTAAGSRQGQTLADAGEFLSVNQSKLLVGTFGAAPIYFGTNDTFAMIVDTSQRVGIGVAATTILGIKAGTSSNDAAVGGVLYVSTAQVGNVGTGEDDLASYSVPANTLAVNGQSLWFEAWGTYGATADNKTIRVRFGTTGTNLVFDSGAIPANTGSWVVRGRVVRTGAATQKGHGFLVRPTTYVSVANGLDQTLSGAVTLKVTGEGVSSNDVVLEGFLVGWDDQNT